MFKLSILISVISGRDQQFDLSLKSLTRWPYDRSQVELLIFIDYPENKSTQTVLRKYKKYFASITVFSVITKKDRINHSVTRRNFLAKKANGEYILFSEPEMFHMENTINNLLQYMSNYPGLTHWVCGPVYASFDLANSLGKIVDGHISQQDISKLINYLESGASLDDMQFKDNFFLVDYSYYSTPFFIVMFHRKNFLGLKGLNQNLKVRGFEEIEFYKRFSEIGGKIVVYEKIPTIHIPHTRNIDTESQISWNLFNSTMPFDRNQKIGKITDAKFTKINLR